MKQGVFSNHRVRLLLSPGSKGYRAQRKGERKRRSVRGCIVGPDIKSLSLTLIKKGDKEMPGLTDETKPRRLGPKRATGIRKLYGIEKGEGEKTLQNSVALIKKHIIRRTFKSKKNVNANRHKAPKIQRLVTEARLRRKRVQKEDKIKRWKRSLASAEEYKKIHDTWITKKKADLKQQRKASKASAGETKPAVATKPIVATKPVETKKPVAAKKEEKPKKK
jgi:small subunit ribosomal protein S6e